MWLQLNPLPVIPRTVTLRSKVLEEEGPGGKIPASYKFVKGKALEVTDETDVEMLLGCIKRVTGYGGRGVAEIPWFVVVGPEETLARMSREDKLEQAFLKLAGKSVDEFLAEALAEDVAPSTPAVEGTDDDDL